MRASSFSPLERMLRDPALLLLGQLVADVRQHVAEAQNAVERRAQLMAHRGQEVALEAVRFVQGQVGLGQFVHLAVEVGVDLAQLILHVDEVAEHAIESMAQILEFVAGLDLAADVELPGRDGVADLLEMLDRLDDDVADDDLAAGHDEQGGHQGRRDEQGPVVINAAFDRFCRELDHHDAHQIVFIERVDADFVAFFLGFAVAFKQLLVARKARSNS